MCDIPLENYEQGLLRKNTKEIIEKPWKKSYHSCIVAKYYRNDNL